MADGVKITDPATLEACRFVNKYHEQMGRLAPKQFSAEEQHAITVLTAYIREQGSARLPSLGHSIRVRDPD